LIAVPLVYVVVLNYCSAEDTLRCVEAARRIEYGNWRLLVLDNASPDGGGAILAARLGPEEFVQLPKNTGYAGGNNVGMSIALERRAEYVLIINPDVRLPPDAISCYVDILERDHTIGALNSIQVGGDGDMIDEKFRMGILRPLGYDQRRLSEMVIPELLETKLLFGAALMLPVRSIRLVGGFDPLYFAYGEEVDLCRRITFHGLRLVVTASCPVVHLRTAERAENGDFRVFLRVKGYYLSRLKAPTTSMRRELRHVVTDLLQALIGKAPSKFPYTHFHVERKHAVQVLIWLLWHLLLAWRHRAKEKEGRCHV
jgi:GT2 family glycosyltransferase